MIKVIHPGLFTTVQDLGRKDFQAFGVPVAGAMDEYSARCANLLVGNDENAAMLEFTMMGGSYLFEQDALIVITGAYMNAQINGKPVENWRAYKINTCDELTFSFATEGCRAYLAIAGGIKVKKIMGSASTHTRSKLGGYEGRALQKGDALAIGKATYAMEKVLPDNLLPKFNDNPCIRILPGPQDGAFEKDVFSVLQEGEYEIQADSDRMGYRLVGQTLKHKQSADIISDALFKGAVQVPGNGQPIIMLSDCQTTGGYTKLCFVITPDLNILAQCKPGGKIKFKVVDEEQAVEAFRIYQQSLAKVRQYLQKGNRQFIVNINGTKYDVQLQEK